MPVPDIRRNVPSCTNRGCRGTVRPALAAALCTPHLAIHGFDGELAGVCRRIGFPTGNLALARLPCGKTDMHRLLHRLINGVRVQAKHRANSGGGGWTKMSD